jgi:hypothetical protein
VEWTFQRFADDATPRKVGAKVGAAGVEHPDSTASGSEDYEAPVGDLAEHRPVT